MVDDDGYNFEKTKSTILDYLLLVRDVKWAVASTLGVSFFIFLIGIGLFVAVTGETKELQKMGLNLSVHKNLAIIFLYSFLIIAFVFSLLFFNGGLILKIILKGRRQERELLQIQSNFIRRSYLMNFELVEPEIFIDKGNPRLEKIMNHLGFVFPEIDRVNKKRIKKKNSVEKYVKKFKRKLHFLRNYDLPIKTPVGWYVVQFYEDVVKFDDVEKIVKKFSFEKSIGSQIQRVIIIGKKFDTLFDKEKLVQKMDTLKRKIHVDIISEDEYGYSTIWID